MQNDFPWPQLPDDPEELVRLALSTQNDVREAAWEKLKPIIDELAARVLQRVRLLEADRDDFVNECYCKLLAELHKFNPAAGSFRAWGYRVLYNLAVDKARELKRRLEAEVSVPPEVLALLEARDAKEESKDNFLQVFCPAQLQMLSQLPPKRRVIALGVCGLHRRIPRELWRQWLDEAGIPETFPPPTDAKEVPEHFRQLAKELDMNPTALRQHFYRAKDVLREVLREENK